MSSSLISPVGPVTSVDQSTARCPLQALRPAVSGCDRCLARSSLKLPPTWLLWVKSRTLSDSLNRNGTYSQMSEHVHGRAGSILSPMFPLQAGKAYLVLETWLK